MNNFALKKNSRSLFVIAFDRLKSAVTSHEATIKISLFINGIVNVYV